MSPQRETTDDPTREQLVAYLDGELADAECEAIESRLASDAALREQLQGLERAWNALDELPSTTASPDFAKSTIEMVAVQAERDAVAMTTAVPVQRRRRGYTTIAACVAALAFGFVVVRWTSTRGDRLLVESLPVVYQLDTLQDAGGADFLRQLPEVAGPLLAAADAEQLAADLGAWRAIAAGGPAERAAWVAELEPTGKTRLLDATRRFHRDLPGSRRESVLATYAELNAAEDRDQLFETALAYHAWLATRTASEQSQLRQMDEAERLDKLRREARRVANAQPWSLSAEEAAAVRRAISDLGGSPEVDRALRLARSRIRGLGRQQGRQPGRGLPGVATERVQRRVEAEIAKQEKFPAGLIVLMAAQVARQPPRGDPTPRNEQDGPPQDQRREVWEAIQSKLLADFPQPVRARIERQTTEQRRARALSNVVLRAVRDGTESFDLEAYFASEALTDDQRHALLALPTQEMLDRLREHYINHELGGFEGAGRPVLGRLLFDGQPPGPPRLGPPPGGPADRPEIGRERRGPPRGPRRQDARP